MFTFLIFILILSLLVFVHELGHFLMAKRAGVGVAEFGLGLPPRLFGKKVGETLYSINLLPFGGFVRLIGEDFEGDLAEAKKDPKNFLSKKPSVRAGIIAAGIFMNFVLACFFYYLLLTTSRFESQAIPFFSDYNFRFGEQQEINTVVVAVESGSPAQAAGIVFGEAIVAVDGATVQSVKDIRSIVGRKSGQLTRVSLKDITSPVANVREVSLTPVLNEEGFGQLGVGLSPFVKLSYKNKVEQVFVGPLHAYNIAAYTVKVFSELISAAFRTKDITPVTSGMSGPVGIFAIFSGVMELSGEKLLLNIFDFVALLSLSLSIMNLLPFPALDGGRLVFVVFEGVTGKRISPLVERRIHTLGMALLLFLIGIITFSDITRFR